LVGYGNRESLHQCILTRKKARGGFELSMEEKPPDQKKKGDVRYNKGIENMGKEAGGIRVETAEIRGNNAPRSTDSHSLFEGSLPVAETKCSKNKKEGEWPAPERGEGGDHCQEAGRKKKISPAKRDLNEFPEKVGRLQEISNTEWKGRVIYITLERGGGPPPL